MAYEFKKLSAVSTINAPSEDAHVLIEENGSVKRVPKNAVDESVISKLAEVTTADSTTDTTNVLIEENGEIKKAPKSAVHGKRELVYEFTPGIDADGNPVTDVEFFAQNIDEDLTWLTNSIEGMDFELELVQYGVYREETNDDSGNTVFNDVVDTNFEITLKTGSAYAGITFTKDKVMNTEGFYGELHGVPVSFSNEYFDTGADITIVNKMQLNMETGGHTQVDIGGDILIEIMTNKSIKIYKITY